MTLETISRQHYDPHGTNPVYNHTYNIISNIPIYSNYNSNSNSNNKSNGSNGFLGYNGG